MRKLFFLIGLLLSALPAFGQGGFTTVSGTIVDPNGVPWSGGTISAQLITFGGAAPTLNGVGFSTSTSPVPLSSTGFFSMRLADSGVIVPSNTQWQFTANIAPGVLPPFGKGAQSLTITTPINCGTNTPAACASNAMNITAALTPVPALTLAIGGLPSGLTYVAPTLTVSTAGTGNGCLALSGNTSGTSTLCTNATASAITANSAYLAPLGSAGSPSLSSLNFPTEGFYFSSGSINVSTGGVSNFGLNGNGPTALVYGTVQNCAVSSASPAACGFANAGMVAVPTGATTYTVNTAVAGANSEIFIQQNTSTAAGTRLSVTCNTTANVPLLTAVVGGTSFTFSLTAPVTNPACFNFWMVN